MELGIALGLGAGAELLRRFRHVRKGCGWYERRMCSRARACDVVRLACCRLLGGGRIRVDPGYCR